MTLIRWQDSYNLGIDEIDHEHKQLFELINIVHERSIDASHGSMEDALGQIIARVSVHFTNEERVMLAMDFPEYWAHKGDHEQLIDQLCELVAQYRATHNPDSAALARRLESWFMLHFRTFDARFHQFVQQTRD